MMGARLKSEGEGVVVRVVRGGGLHGRIKDRRTRDECVGGGRDIPRGVGTLMDTEVLEIAGAWEEGHRVVASAIQAA